MTIRKQNCGQAYVITVLFLVVLLGMSAAVLDVGSWYRSQRAVQATADAAALAGAQELPYDTALARSVAVQWANKNGGGVASGGVTFSSKVVANDTINVVGSRPAKGFFAKVFGLKSITVTARASARASNLSAAYGVAPITVHYKHPLLNCSGGGATLSCNPTFNKATTLNLEDIHKAGSGNGAGAFGLINLDQNDASGTASSTTVAGWLANGYDQLMDLGKYYSVPSAEFNNSKFISAMQSMLGKELLFPVYRLLTGPGANATYDIVGWVGFIPTSFNPNGTPATVSGSFTRMIAHGIQVQSGGKPTFGVRSVELTQ
jgi:Flp pilus assembly protein TadG